MRPIPLGLAHFATLLRPRTGALRRGDPPPSLTQYFLQRLFVDGGQRGLHSKAATEQRALRLDPPYCDPDLLARVKVRSSWMKGLDRARNATATPGRAGWTVAWNGCRRIDDRSWDSTPAGSVSEYLFARVRDFLGPARAR